jgi:hypothetical protein
MNPLYNPFLFQAMLIQQNANMMAQQEMMKKMSQNAEYGDSTEESKIISDHPNRVSHFDSMDRPGLVTYSEFNEQKIREDDQPENIYEEDIIDNDKNKFLKNINQQFMTNNQRKPFKTFKELSDMSKFRSENRPVEHNYSLKDNNTAKGIVLID